MPIRSNIQLQRDIYVAKCGNCLGSIPCKHLNLEILIKDWYEYEDTTGSLLPPVLVASLCIDVSTLTHSSIPLTDFFSYQCVYVSFFNKHIALYLAILFFQQWNFNTFINQPTFLSFHFILVNCSLRFTSSTFQRHMLGDIFYQKEN